MVEKLAEIIFSEHTKHILHTRCKVQIREIFHILPPDFAFIGGLEYSGKMFGLVEQHNAAESGVIPIFYTTQLW